MDQINLMTLYCPKCYFVTKYPDRHWKTCLRINSKTEIQRLKSSQREDIYNKYIPQRVIPLDKVQCYADAYNIPVQDLKKILIIFGHVIPPHSTCPIQKCINSVGMKENENSSDAVNQSNEIERIFSLIQPDNNIKKAISNPSKKGHITLFRYVISSLLIRYCQSPVVLKEFKVKDFLSAEKFNNNFFYHIIGTSCKTTICVSNDFHNILKEYYIVYRSHFSCSENDCFLLNSKGIPLGNATIEMSRFLLSKGYNTKFRLKSIQKQVKKLCQLDIPNITITPDVKIAYEKEQSMHMFLGKYYKVNIDGNSFCTMSNEIFRQHFPVEVNSPAPSLRATRRLQLKNPSKLIANWRYRQSISRVHFILETKFKYSKTVTLNAVMSEAKKQSWSILEDVAYKAIKHWKPAIHRRSSQPKMTNNEIIKKSEEQSWPGLIIVNNLPNRGRGVKAMVRFEKGDIICNYNGKILNSKNGLQAYNSIKDGNMCYMYYFRSNDNSFWIDASEEDGSFGRLMNHSKLHPNVQTRLLIIEGKPHLIMVAKNQILPGAELFYNYNDPRPIKELEAGLQWLNSCICCKCSPNFEYALVDPYET